VAEAGDERGNPSTGSASRIGGPHRRVDGSSAGGPPSSRQKPAGGQPAVQSLDQLNESPDIFREGCEQQTRPAERLYPVD
jgi:hypothetical protein